MIVSVGRGISKDVNKGIELAEQLAAALGGGVVGASRAVTDAGWMTADHQVGQTGKTVHPKIYVALGISGAIQHTAGMQDSECIIAVNKNESAPIFGVADYGIVGDVEEILPLLTAALDSGEKLPAPPMVKMKRPTPPKPAPIGDRYVCSGVRRTSMCRSWATRTARSRPVRSLSSFPPSGCVPSARRRRINL